MSDLLIVLFIVAVVVVLAAAILLSFVIRRRRYYSTVPSDLMPERSTVTISVRNPYLTILVVAGVLAIVGGGILALTGLNSVSSSRDASELAAAIMGTSFVDYNDTSASTTQMWIGIVIAIIGVVCLIAALAIAAVKHTAVPGGTTTPSTAE